MATAVGLGGTRKGLGRGCVRVLLFVGSVWCRVVSKCFPSRWWARSHERRTWVRVCACDAACGGSLNHWVVSMFWNVLRAGAHEHGLVQGSVRVLVLVECV